MENTKLTATRKTERGWINPRERIPLVEGSPSFLLQRESKSSKPQNTANCREPFPFSDSHAVVVDYQMTISAGLSYTRRGSLPSSKGGTMKDEHGLPSADRYRVRIEARRKNQKNYRRLIWSAARHLKVSTRSWNGMVCKWPARRDIQAGWTGKSYAYLDMVK
ncbi:hypothetical protein AUEXF2481DRAFT_41368 [Aureobasidium subglaciale EXF-2481]|uniref:Uncharacterized protein n=1 Tax=Aureobasidium subglaciale (strain EXF-2481) TaxID=1043005 RepID=A0A074Y8V4_AURSE|nr:uncharacterized protein AUEXF2481DRAFT_41368 [Aureobasidium subglaciale EXF-2481]KEQ94193.1 hypothetical protein AUEXF2481DRAFT_41368 [Aureobasidium subglaciale EXF-2481]